MSQFSSHRALKIARTGRETTFTRSSGSEHLLLRRSGGKRMRNGGMSSIVGQRKYIRVCAGRRHGLLSGISAI